VAGVLEVTFAVLFAYFVAYLLLFSLLYDLCRSYFNFHFVDMKIEILSQV
jgi:hypothetical protein